MSKERPPSVFLCNGATLPSDLDGSKVETLNYLPSGPTQPNVRLGLPDFIRSVYFLPPRCLDLLEIAAYVFAGDRLSHRGSTVGVEYQAWTRDLHFVCRVRDFDFWSQPDVGAALQSALAFVTGDQSYRFTFQPGHDTPPTSLFDDKAFTLEPAEDQAVMLFSGGIDSLAGAVQRLRESEDHVCLVSHQSRGAVVRTQRALAEALSEQYPGRVSHYQFRTHLQGIRAREESQRTRSFLFSSVAFAIATAMRSNSIFVYENGVTSLNFERRESLLNARASRTTHPQTLGRLEQLFSMISEGGFRIETPFLWKTKTEVISYMKEEGHADLLSSSVSCSHTFNAQSLATHCGDCFQCVDRRVGVYGAKAEQWDNSSLYSTDIISSSISSQESKTTVVDYLRQASNFASWNQDLFYMRSLDDIQHLFGWVHGYDDEIDLVDKIWDLCARHGQHVAAALRRMRDVHEEVFDPLPADSLLQVISDREFLREPIERLVSSIQERLGTALPKLFQTERPRNERDLNDKIEALLEAWKGDLNREHPAVPFAGAGVVPDFSPDRGHLLIEGKYIRKSTTPSKATEGMAADLTKYPQEAHILFVVYDPDRAIADRDRLKRDFEGRGRCTLCVLP